MGDVADVTDAAGGAILISPVVEPGVWDPDQCYDDKDPNSIEHPFLERFLAQVGEKSCYDKNKVFVQGHSSGGWYSNMIGWTHTTELIRAMSSNGGGLPDDSAERPKLNGKPMAGLWIHPTKRYRAAHGGQKVREPRSGGQQVRRRRHESGRRDRLHEGAVGGLGRGRRRRLQEVHVPGSLPGHLLPAAGWPRRTVNWHTDAAWAMFNALP